MGLLENDPYSWNYSDYRATLTQQQNYHISERSCAWGSTSINAVIYIRCPPEDYNCYVNFTGGPGWSWENLKTYFFKNEKWVPPADGHNTIGQYDPAIHSLDGMNAVSLQGYPQPTDERVLRVTSELSDEFPLCQFWNT